MTTALGTLTQAISPELAAVDELFTRSFRPTCGV